MNDLASINQRRRRFILAGASVALTPSMLALAAPGTVTVVTSYPDEFVSRIEAAFEKAHPEHRLRVIWRMPADAADYLQSPASSADVYWSASPRTFARLAESGIWAKIPVDRSSLPVRIGNAILGDSGGFYTATEVAGFGFAVAPESLRARQLPIPADWSDLADARYSGLIALPVPARVGFAPPLVEIVLQAYGWERGWALWSEIAANANWVERGSTFMTDEIAAGRSLIGVSIDFFVNSAIANGASLRFVYPRHTGLNPAHIAMTKAAPNPKGAAAFIDFMLSNTGQRQLLHPDIRRLPVRPDAYASLPAGSFNPFAVAEAGGLQFDSDRARPRLTTTAAIFQQMLVVPHLELKALWQRLRHAETSGKAPAGRLAAIRGLLGKPPIGEVAANDQLIQRQIGPRLEGNEERRISAPEVAWQATCRVHRDEAARMLDEVGA